MYYIFNSSNKVTGWCDYEPNHEDLLSREEYCIRSEKEIHKPQCLIVGKYGSVWEPAPLEKTQEQLLQEKTNTVLIERDNLLSSSDWIVNRHLEQKMLNLTTTLSDEDFNNYLLYRQELRDITSDVNFPYVELPALLQK